MNGQLYAKFETDISFEYLKKIAKIADESLCLIGGWAVYFTVNKNFIERTKRSSYLGSRDIDLGFYIPNDWAEEKVRKSSLAQIANKLEKEGFCWAGSRLQAAFHQETGKMLTEEESKAVAEPFLYRLYVDLMVNESTDAVEKAFNQHLFDEELLNTVFGNPSYRKGLEYFRNKVFMPIPRLLLAMKLKSFPNRTKDDKRTKDICDICALSMFSENINDLRNGLSGVLKHSQINAAVGRISEEDYKTVEGYFGIGWEELETNVRALIA